MTAKKKTTISLAAVAKANKAKDNTASAIASGVLLSAPEAEVHPLVAPATVIQEVTPTTPAPATTKADDLFVLRLKGVRERPEYLIADDVAGKERWFEKKRLAGFTMDGDKAVIILEQRYLKSRKLGDMGTPFTGLLTDYAPVVAAPAEEEIEITGEESVEELQAIIDSGKLNAEEIAQVQGLIFEMEGAAGIEAA